MTILAQIPYMGASLTAQIIDVFTGSNRRKLATVRALAGQPFAAWTHGGWAYSDTNNVRVDLLSGVAVTADLQTLGERTLIGVEV